MKFKNYVIGVLSCLIVVLLVLVFIIVGANGNLDKTEITSTKIEEKLTSATDLITSKYHYTNVDKYSNSKEFNSWSIPFTDKTFILSYEGEIQFGVDLTKAEVTVDAVGKTVIVEIPKTEMLSHSLLEDTFKLYDEKNSLFNPISIGDYQEFAITQKKETEDSLDMTKIDEQNLDSVKKVVELMLPDEYGVIVKYKQ